MNTFPHILSIGKKEILESLSRALNLAENELNKISFHKSNNLNKIIFDIDDKKWILTASVFDSENVSQKKICINALDNSIISID